MQRWRVLALPLSLAVVSLAAMGWGTITAPATVFDSLDGALTSNENWKPQYGALPARTERLADGTPVLVLEAHFTREGDRAYWDWYGPVDLSSAGRIRFEMSAVNSHLLQTIGIYFGTPSGWYVRFWGPRHFQPQLQGVSPGWQFCTFRLDSFSQEGHPNGWNHVDRLRFSAWSDGPGHVVFRLRRFGTDPNDPSENFLLNGSFEIASVGLPYAWGTGHWGIGNLPWATRMDLWRKHWHVDSTVARHGRLSLCLENTADLPLLQAVSVWHTPPPSIESLVLSAWLKSDQEKLRVHLQCIGGGNTQQVQTDVGKEWRQVTLANVPRRERMRVAVAPQAPGRLWIDAVQLQEGEPPTEDFRPSFGEDSLSQWESSVDWSPPRRTLLVAQGRSLRALVKPSRVGIDRFGRFLLDGQPHLLHALGLEYVSDLSLLDFVARSGFRDICIEVGPRISTEQLKAIFDRCAQVGLHAIPWFDRMPREQLAQHVRSLKEHPALLCWYVLDEPSERELPEVEARLKLVKEIDPLHPAYVNYLRPHLAEQKGDIYSTDVYPIPHGTPMDAVRAVTVMRERAEREKKPVWMWLQGTGYAYFAAREPTPKELSCMVYGCLIEGARGIKYFAQIPHTKECFDEMRALCVELDALTPILHSLEPAPAVRCEVSSVLVRAFQYRGAIWVLAVNTLPVHCRARFVLSGSRVAGRINVQFEARSLRIRQNGWTDDFAPYERHVYRLAVAK